MGLQGVLRKIKDVPRLLVRLSNMAGNFKADDFRGLQESMANLVLLRDTLIDAHRVRTEPYSRLIGRVQQV